MLSTQVITYLISLHSNTNKESNNKTTFTPNAQLTPYMKIHEIVQLFNIWLNVYIGHVTGSYDIGTDSFLLL